MWKLACAAALVISCGKTDKDKTQPGNPAPGATTGGAGGTTWKGTWTRTEPMPGGGALTLTVPASGPGTITAETSLCIKPNTPIDVTIEGSNVKMAISAGETTASYAGTINGNEMTGTMTVTCAPGTGKGTFKLTKQ